jgi:signal transduction histidine kinase/CheY-like chemotaxis protein
MGISTRKHSRFTLGVLAGWHAYEGTLHSFLDQVFRGIQAAARDRECNLLLACGVGSGEPGQGRPAWPMLAPDVDFVPVGPLNTDGLIVAVPLTSRTGTRYPSEARYIRDLMADGFPVVFAGAGEQGPTVLVDNEGGIRQALAHLVAHGHRRIAFVAGVKGDEEGDTGRRLRAYQAAVREWGLASDPGLIAYGYHNPQGGRKAMQQILDSGTSFTAVFASNDESAIGAIEALRNAGLVVPQDVAVIGFDDRLEARAHAPPLTTVHHPMFDLGYQAVALLLERIEGLAEGAETVRIPTRLVVRESCGCLPGAIVSETGAEPASLDQLEQEHGGFRPEIVRLMSEVVATEVQRLSLDELDYLCSRLVEAFASSLEQSDPSIFRLAMQQILQRAALVGDDPYAWQAAVSVLRDEASVLLGISPGQPSLQQVDDMLHQARVAISGIARGQYTRHLIHQSDVTDHLGRMTARFLTVQDEAEVFEVLAEDLPQVGIQHAAVAFYEQGEGDDPVAWSVLQSSQDLKEEQQRFASREFPPFGLYPQSDAFSLAVLPLFVQEDLIGFVAFDGGNLEPCADIARQLGAALRSVWLYREAVEGRRLAEEADLLKSRFLSMVSHELRTPLNLISGLSGMLLEEGEWIEADRCAVGRDDVARIYASAQHLDGLIRDVLDLARSEVGQLKLVCEPLELDEVLQAVSMIGGQLAQDKRLAWRAEVPEDLPPVWGDRTRLRQVALNLVNNAIKFTERGEVALLVTVDDDGITVAVQDTGLGIPAEEQEVIFEEFRQSDRSTARGYGGLGLGLAICKRLVEMHGGQIGVRSSGEEGAGSTFYFTLPVMTQDAAFSRAEVSLAGAGQVLLLVKDEAGGEVLKDHLMQQGFEVQAHRVDEAADWMAWLLAGPPEAVVLDLGLASERGWEILKVLKENPATRDIPVLFYTVTSDGAGGSALEMDYLTKPVGTAELAETLMYRGLLGEGEGRKILVVDDEPGVLDLHARIVEAQSPCNTVLRARNGREALEVVQQERPDLVLLDLMMPEMDGFEFLETMREDEVSRAIPVVVLTGQALTEADMARLNRGVASVLGKGLFSVEETLAHVEAALTHRQQLGAEAQRLVRACLAYIHAHFAEPISLSDLAFHVGLGERHLGRCFRQEMGVTPFVYLNRYRIRQAQTLLEAGDQTVTEVAREVGFSDSSYFTRVFRREVGISPSAYRRGERGGIGGVDDA